MATIGLFYQHLKQSSETTSIEKMFLINTFQYFGYDSNQTIRTSTFSKTLNILFHCDYWFSKKDKVFEAIKKEVRNFNDKSPVDINLAQIKKNIDQQIISIDDPINLMTIVSRSLKKSKLYESQKIKLKVLENNYIMALILDNQSNLEVKIFTNKVKLQKGSLVALSPMTNLYYNSFMELRDNVFQQLFVSGSLFCFKAQEDRVLGHCINFRDFQLKEKFSGSYNYNSPLFYPLKSIEKHYIDLASDPFYTELCENIDQSIDALKLKQPESLVFAKKSIKMAYLALKYVFDDDSFLKYKLIELERTIQTEVQWVKQEQENLQN